MSGEPMYVLATYSRDGWVIAFRSSEKGIRMLTGFVLLPEPKREEVMTMAIGMAQALGADVNETGQGMAEGMVILPADSLGTPVPEGLTLAEGVAP